MKKHTGKKVFDGIAIGKVLFYAKKENIVKQEKVSDVEKEIERYEEAKNKAVTQLNALYEKALVDVGEEHAQIFEVHAMMLDDEDYKDSVYDIIRSQEANAEYAVTITGENFAEMFANMEDDYFKARSADIKDISNRVVTILCGNDTDVTNWAEPIILVADDLVPSETIQMDKSKLLGFATRLGSTNSHTAILARTMGIPALINIEIEKEWNNKLAILDGYTSTIIIEPDEETLEIYKKKQQEELEKKELLEQLKGKETVTTKGQEVKLFANIGSPSDLATVLANDAEGIGLFRSEFLYLESDHLPTEEEQFQAYKVVAEGMQGKKVIIRTLDLGADKQVSYFDLGHEENPALGYRAIRICLTEIDIFKTQLRALFRASAYGNISIMYPMIISVEEVRKIKEIVKEVKAELRAENIPFEDVEEGIMIETPASVMISDLLAKEVDFFSIGTNDLTQYTLAIDRQNDKIDEFCDTHHEAILRSIKMVVDNSHKAGIWTGICGELGADKDLTAKFIEMGVDELSVAPSSILPIRKIIREY